MENSEFLEELSGALKRQLGIELEGYSVVCDQITLNVCSEDIFSLVRALRDDLECRFTILIDIAGVDHMECEKRFSVVYNFLSIWRNRRLRVRVSVGEGGVVPSLCRLYPTANWFEREVFDMFGVTFSNHPDMRRILTDYEFAWHPLRKDFPVSGYVEVRYDEEKKSVVYEPVNLVQNYRDFDFVSPWEGVADALLDDKE